MTAKLDKKERMGLLFGVLALCLVFAVLLYMPAGPLKDYSEAREEVQQLRTELKQKEMMCVLEKERLASHHSLEEKLAVRPASFDLFSFVNRILNKTNILDRAKLDNYRTKRFSQKQPMVQLRLERVSLEELVNFFHQIYASDNLIALYKMDRLRPAQNEKGLDCDIVLASIKE